MKVMDFSSFPVLLSIVLRDNAVPTHVIVFA